jgi:hypothetical protein
VSSNGTNTVNDLKVGHTRISGGTNGQFLYDNNGILGEQAGGGGGTPGAPSTSIQYNNAGAFGGIWLFTFNGSDTLQLKATDTDITSSFLNVDGSLSVSNQKFLGVNFINGARLSFDPTSSFVFSGPPAAMFGSPDGEANQFGALICSDGTPSSDPLSAADGGFLQQIELQRSFTANYSLTHSDLDTCSDNTGASGEVDISLLDPTAWAKGLRYSFCVTVAQTLKIVATGGVTIYLGASQSAANGNLASSTVGSRVELISSNFGGGRGYPGEHWIAKSSTGSWSVT